MDIENKKILVICPHPDDEVIACGGFIAKYHKQIDVLCINSSGVKYDNDNISAEEIAENRCQEFYKVMKLANVNDYDITKIWGIPPMIDSIKKNYEHYANRFDYSNYDIILVPHAKDHHIEHRYVSNVLLKNILKKRHYKKNLIIMQYELWSPIAEPNYYEDITQYVNLKKQFIDAYKSRSNSHYAERILALNKYRTLLAYFWNPEKYVEAFYVSSVKDYLGRNKLEKLFSVKNQFKGNIKYKVFTIFGIKFSFKISQNCTVIKRKIYRESTLTK